MSCTFCRNSASSSTRGGVGAGAGGVGGGGGTFTVIRAVSVAVPPGPIAVAWYVTEDCGLTARLPVAITSPRPGSIRTFVAFRASHVNVVFWPRLIVVGAARSVMAGAGGGGGATGGGGGGGVGAAATFFLQPNDSSRRSVRTTNATFLMREE